MKRRKSSKPIRILAGDLGGTKSNLGLFEAQRGKLKLLYPPKRFRSQAFTGAETVIDQFLREAGVKITAACFAVAGPVVNNTVRVTNLPWVVDARSLAKFLRVRQVMLLNDLEATAYGLRALPKEDFETLHEGVPNAAGNQVLIAAGTGLGEAILVWDGKRHVVVPSEAGHADFAPHTDQEIELLKFLKAKHEFVSAEIILSGRGFREIHEFLDGNVRHPSFDDANADPAPEITRRALEESCPVCVRTVDMWNGIYGAEAGNLALRAVALGGVFVAGGIAVKILPKLRDGRFVKALANKEKLGSLLSRLPVYVALNESAPLWGAAWVAVHGR
jgi:glucokinase